MPLLSEKPQQKKTKRKRHKVTRNQLAAAGAFAGACVVAIGLIFAEIVRGNEIRGNVGVVGLIVLIILLLLVIDQMETWRGRGRR